MRDAEAFARIAHEGQVDKAGKPYIEHVAAVARDVRREMVRWNDYAHADPLVDQAVQIAWLHDVIEDTDYEPEDLLAEGFSKEVVVAVSDLEKPAHQPYAEYIDYLVDEADLPTILVKIADVEDNSDPERLALLPDDVRARLERKYAPALVILREAAVRLGWKAPNPQI